MPGIFISYRREDTAGHAGRLFDRLTQHFGKGRIFMDVSDIEPGVDFVDAIDQAVGSCEILIVVIGREWLLCTEPGGQRRLDNPKDFIRLEAATALKRNIRVIPVLVQGARMPKSDELPADLEKLSRRQGIEVSDTRWDSDVGQLIKALELALAQDIEAKPVATVEPRLASRQPEAKRKVVATLVSVICVIILAVGGWLFWPQKVAVPRLTDNPLEAAKAVLADRGFILGNVSEEPSETASAGTVIKQQPDAGARTEKGARIDLVIASVPRVSVPDVTRQEFADAEAVLAKAGLQVGKKATRTSTEVSPGAVLSQSPPAGELVNKNTRVDLVLAIKPVIVVPAVLKMNLQDGKALLEKSGLAIGQINKREIVEPIRPETILEQTPRAGAKVESGTTVDVVIAIRPTVVVIPKLLGMPGKEAIALVESHGLAVASVQQVKSARPAGMVLTQSPPAGEKVDWGAKIYLTVAAPLDPAQPAPTISIRAKGQLEIPEGRTVDLDEGNMSTRVEADIGFPRVTTVDRYIEPLNKAMMVKVPRVTPDGKSCASAPLSPARIFLRDLPQNSLVCVRTNQGRYAYFRVTETIGPGPATLKISYLTWN